MLLLSVSALATTPLPSWDDGSARVRGVEVAWTARVKGRLVEGSILVAGDGRIGVLSHHTGGVRLTVLSSDGSEAFTVDQPDEPEHMGLAELDGAWVWVNDRRAAIAVEDGAERWSWAPRDEGVPTGDPVMWGPDLVIPGPETLLVDPATGTVRARLRHRADGAAVGDLDGDGADELVLGGRDVAVLDGASRELRWGVRTDEDSVGPPRIWDGHVVLVRPDGWLDVLEGATGDRRQAWYLGPTAPDATTTTAGAVRFAGCVVAPRADGADRRVACVGDTIRWQRGFLHAPILAEPVVGQLDADGNAELLIATAAGELTALDEAGQTVWQWRAPDAIVTRPLLLPAPADSRPKKGESVPDTVVVGSVDGTITALTIDARPRKKRDQGVDRWDFAAPPSLASSEATAEPEIENDAPPAASPDAPGRSLGTLPGGATLHFDGSRLGVSQEDGIRWAEPLGARPGALRIDPEGVAWLTVRPRTGEPVELQLDDEGQPVLEGRAPWMAALSGVVRIGDTPVEDAEVHVVGVEAYTTLTDSAGEYTLVVPRGPVRLGVRHPALVAPRASVVDVASDPVRQDLELFVPAWVRGTLGDADLPEGAPATPDTAHVAGCGEAKVPIDAQGRFVLRDLRRGASCTVSAFTDAPRLYWSGSFVAGETHAVTLEFQEPRKWRRARYVDLSGAAVREGETLGLHTDSDGWVLDPDARDGCVGPAPIRQPGPRSSTRICALRALPVTLVSPERVADAVLFGPTVHVERGLEAGVPRTVWLEPGDWRLVALVSGSTRQAAEHPFSVPGPRVVGLPPPDGVADPATRLALGHPVQTLEVPLIPTPEGLVVGEGVDEQKVDFAPGDLLLTACGVDVRELDAHALDALLSERGGGCNGTVWRGLQRVPVQMPARISSAP